VYALVDPTNGRTADNNYYWLENMNGYLKYLNVSIYCAFCQSHRLIFCRYFMIKCARNKSGHLNEDGLPFESLDWANQLIG